MERLDYLQAVLRVHEEVASDVVEHDGVLPAVQLLVLAPNHAQRLHLPKPHRSVLSFRCVCAVLVKELCRCIRMKRL